MINSHQVKEQRIALNPISFPFSLVFSYILYIYILICKFNFLYEKISINQKKLIFRSKILSENNNHILIGLYIKVYLLERKK